MKIYRKTVLSVVVASALVLLTAPLVGALAATSPFTGVTTAPSKDIIAGSLDEITPQNTVTEVSNIPQVSPIQSALQMPSPSSASFGVVTAFKNPNMSQNTPDSVPPPAPEPSCACGGYAGTVSWSGWDSVGWETTPGGCYACPPPPPPPAPTVTAVVTGGGGGSLAALQSASGISSNGITTQCNSSGSCTVTWGVSNGYGFTAVQQSVSLSSLENGGFGIPNDPNASVNISGGNVVTHNSGVIVSTNAGTNVQDGGSSLAAQDAQIANATASGYRNESQTTIQNVTALGQQDNAQLMKNGNGDGTSSVLQALNGWG